jgi:hypothetical protein
MDQAQLLEFLLDVLERQRLRYAIVGSHASMAYGELRLTNDIDVLVDLSAQSLPEFCAAFASPHFYVSEDGARHAVLKGGTFNIIDPDGGQKIDVFVPASSYDRAQLDRAISMPISATRHAMFVAPEDVIIKKMDYFREGGSEKHLRDITGILKMLGPRVDLEWVSAQAAAMGLDGIWSAIRKRMGE